MRKCPYCDFNSHESPLTKTKNPIPEKQYVAALLADLEQAVPQIWGRKISSIFFGGGTPSLFSPQAIEAILNGVRALAPYEYGAEITLEANPGTVDAAHFTGYKEAGINRLSLGIQSFNNTYLVALGRIHDSNQAYAAAELALETFERVNLDIMYGLPGQSLQDALKDAMAACNLNPAHLSFYHLTLEPNTPFHHNPPSLPDDDTSATMQEEIEHLLAKHGYEHYETSAFGKKGGHCRHNLNYWQFGDYLGIGAGAHSKLSFHDKIMRSCRHKHPARYMENALLNEAVEREWLISQDELGFEFMMNALRLTDGFAVPLFQQRTSLPLSILESRLQQTETRGLLWRDDLNIRPTPLGQRFLNELLQMFL